jgi:transposase-like protein
MNTPKEKEPGRKHPKRYTRKLKKKPEVPGNSRLSDELEEELCKLLRGQMTLTDACQWIGVSRAAVWEWRTKGQEDPSTRYGRFERAIEKALTIAKAYLIRGVAQHNDVRGKIFLLKNRYPNEFRDRIVQELSGPNGTSVPVTMNINPFEIKIVLAGEPEKFQTVPYDGREGLLN